MLKHPVGRLQHIEGQVLGVDLEEVGRRVTKLLGCLVQSHGVDGARLDGLKDVHPRRGEVAEVVAVHHLVVGGEQ